ncbi:MAG: DUF4097 family beta strand repeat protein [Melioribacteraceae bacterium]|nr:DUF4097 family beta strand repeat protein [Melioribacteraceae bacterium]
MKMMNIFLVMIFVSVTASAQDDVFKKTFTVQKGVRLEININPGDIEINSWDRSEIEIYVTGFDEEDKENLKVSEKQNILLVEFDSEWGWSDDVKFSFKVPVSSHLDVHTSGGDIKVSDKIIGQVRLNTSGGDVEVFNVQGELSVRTSGGDIAVGDIAGELSLLTSGGDINIKNTSSRSANVQTMGGDIKVEAAESDFYGRTMGGDIIIGNVGGQVTVITMGGDIELGKVSGSVKMETYGGDLKLAGADGKVNAETKGGDITLYNIKGAIDAKTYGGKIYSELDPKAEGQSTFNSLGGDIIVQLPSNAKAEVKALVKIRGSWFDKSDDYSITSDFLKNEVRSSEDDKELSMEFKINGGGHEIKIMTTNSNIQIIEKK